jgi:hypothetical protein
LKKTKNKLNETYLSVICRQSKPISTGGRDKRVNELSEKGDSCSGFSSSPKSSFPYRLSLDNQAEDFLVPSWYTKNESVVSLPWHPIDIDAKISKEIPLTQQSTDNLTSNDTATSRTFEEPIKYPKVEDIEIFQEQHLKIQRSFKKRQRNSRHHSKTQKDPTVSSNSIEYHFRESRDTVDVRFEGIRNGTANIMNGLAQRTVRRSSTLPTFQTASRDRETLSSDTDAQVQRLRHPPFFQTSYDNLNHGQISGEGRKFRLSTQFSERLTRKKCIHPDILGSNIIFKSESHVKTGAASRKEQTQNLSDVNKTPISSVFTPANDISNFGFNGVPHDAKSLLVKQAKLLLQEDENYTAQLPHPQIPSVEEEIVKKKAEDYILSKREEEQSKVKEQNSSSVHENEKLPVQNMALGSEGECDIHNTTLVCSKNTGIQKEYLEYMSNTNMYGFAVSVPFCDSRPKSCTDLPLSTYVSARQNCEMLTSTIYSSSPLLAKCDLAL